jgi:hypothetical protein
MTLNTSDEEVIAARRHKVAQLRLRGATQRELALSIGCSLGTINGDLTALRQEWRAAAAADTTEHIAAVLAELREVRRAAWAQMGGKGLPIVLQALKQECALLGLDAQSDTLLPGDMTIIVRWHDNNRIIDVTPNDDNPAAAPSLTAADSAESGALPYRVLWETMGQEPAGGDVEPENGAGEAR